MVINAQEALDVHVGSQDRPAVPVIFVVTLVISGAAQLHIRSTFSRWSRVTNSAGLSGAQVGEQLASRVSFGGARGAATGISFRRSPLDSRWQPWR
jgi:hypothetical protein